MTISHVGFRNGVVSGTCSVDVRIETIGTDGLPTGTLWATNTNVVSGTLTSSTWHLVALTASASITKGQIFAVKILYNAGTSIILQRINGLRTTIGSLPYQVVNTGSPTKGLLTNAINLALGSSATTFYSVPNTFPVDTIANNTFDNTNGARRGLRFQVPFACRMAGVAWYNSSLTGDYQVALYADDGTTLLEGTSTIEGNASANSTTAHITALFDTAVELSTGTWYRAVLIPQESGTNINLGVVTIPSTDYLSAFPHKANAHYVTYASSAWDTSATTSLPAMDIIIDQVLTYS